jgi:hypothetical protein
MKRDDSDPTTGNRLTVGDELFSTEPIAQAVETPANADAISLPITEITSTNGVVVKCTYLAHRAFNRTHNLWLSLHLIFVKLGPTKCYSWCSALRLVYTYLLDFVSDHNNKNPKPLGISHFDDLTASTFKGFENYLRRNGKNVTSAQRLKSALKIGAKSIESIPTRLLPTVLVDKIKPTTPLNTDGVEGFSNAGKRLVDKLREKLKVRALIDEAQPYTLEEIRSLYSLNQSREGILVWAKYLIENNLNLQIDMIKSRINICPDFELKALLSAPKPVEAFRAFYHANKIGVEIPGNYKSNLKKESRYYKTDLDPYRVTKTFIMNGYPLELDPAVRNRDYSPSKLINYASLDDVVKHLIHKCCRTSPTRKLMNLPPTPSIEHHLFLYYPTLMEMSALTAFMMLQSGWNKESVTDIDPENYEHPLTATIENRLKIITSEKYRSQTGKAPYDNPKTVITRADSNNPYSLYNLILLAKDISAPLAKHTEGMIDPLRNKPVNSMLSFLRSWKGNDRNSANTVDFRSNFSVGIKRFLAEYEIIDNGERLTSAENFTTRLRSTWMLYNTGSTPTSFLSFLLGHEHRDTTDESYDSSPVASRRRMLRLRSALEDIVELLRAGKVEGMISKHAQAKATTKVVFFHLPPFDRALWGCGDQKKPDWPGSPKLEKDEKCSAIEHCLSCSQQWIIEDSLPYLFERIEHIEELLEDKNFIEFGSRLEVERDRIQHILNDWPKGQDLENAVEYRNKHKPLLPRNLQELRLIFKTSSSD